MQLSAVVSGSNVIIQDSTNTGTYVLSRKFNNTVWEDWDGTGWGGTAVLVSVENFTDYSLADGVYQYRVTLTSTPTYLYSSCVVIGSDPVGWTFENYIVPDGLFGEVLTSDDMKYSYLWGVDFIASSGITWKDSQTREFIRWSVFQLERKLNIDIFPRTNYCDDDKNESVEEEELVRKEFPYPNRRNHKYNIRMRHRPIRAVTRFDFYSPQDSKILDLLPWMRLDRRNGQLNYRPKAGINNTFTSYGWPWNLLLDAYGYRDAFHIDYTSGFENASLIPDDLRDIVGKITALKMMNVIGDGLLAGFSSSSISLDGLSESFSSTQSATSAYMGARIKVYTDDVKQYIEENRSKYGNYRIGSI